MEKNGTVNHDVFNADWYGAFRDLFCIVQKLYPKAFMIAIYYGYGEWSAMQQPWAMYYVDGTRRSKKKGAWEHADAIQHLDITSRINSL